MVDVQKTVRKFFPAMSMYETMMHILYAKQQQQQGIIETDRNMRVDYAGTINDLINMGIIVRLESDSRNLKFTELGLKKINYMREVRGLVS